MLAELLVDHCESLEGSGPFRSQVHGYEAMTGENDAWTPSTDVDEIKPPKRPIPKSILGLDLHRVNERCQKKMGWSQDEANRAELEYRMFLTLCLENPDVFFVPTAFFDEFWHAHILHLGGYLRDTKMVFGHVLLHEPNELAPQSKVDNYLRTASVFTERFGYCPVEYQEIDALGCCGNKPGCSGGPSCCNTKCGPS